VGVVRAAVGAGVAVLSKLRAIVLPASTNCVAAVRRVVGALRGAGAGAATSVRRSVAAVRAAAAGQGGALGKAVSAGRSAASASLAALISSAGATFISGVKRVWRLAARNRVAVLPRRLRAWFLKR